MTLIDTSDLQERRESALIDKGRQDPQRTQSAARVFNAVAVSIG
ncbi:hypothetical protein ACRJ4B_04575 [Streptomyces sp. GTA36]|nr:hypothetical protein [Streptomyces phaeochromogenes]